MDYDLVVIGGGAGGLAVVREARRRGASVAMIQDGRVGGDCTFTGCVPSKALIAGAARGDSFREVSQAVERAVETMAATETADVLRGEGIDVYDGRGRFRAADRIDVDGTTLAARRVVIATGSAPAPPPIEGLGDVDYLTNESLFGVVPHPASLLVLGAGPTGCEMAQAHARLGVAVTLIEMADRVLPLEEHEASEVTAGALRAEGVDVRTGQLATKVEASAAGVRIHTTAGDTAVDAERVFVATGRRPVTDGLNLEAAGVEVDEHGWIRVNPRLRTSASAIYAVGDVTGQLLFTHAADEMGRVATANALRWYRNTSWQTRWIPWTIFTTPEVARVGMTEATAAAHGGRVAYLPLTELDRAIIEDRTDGFIKLIAGPRKVLRGAGGGRVLGATIVAPRAGEMIHEVSLAMRTRMFTGRLAQSLRAYPTWSMGVQKAAAQFFFEIEGREARPARR